jgi:Tfp pilus assembly PilM family ATPase
MRKTYNAITGLDVQANSLSLVSLVLQGRSLRLSGAAYQILPAGVIESGNWRNPERMCEALQQGCAALGAPVKTVVLSVATDAVITSELMLPHSEFAHQQCAEVRAALQRLSPWPLADTVADWRRYDSERVLLAMCRAEVIDTARRCLLDIGVQLRHVEPECESHWRLLKKLQRMQKLDQSVAMLVIVQTGLLSLSIFCSGALHFSHSFRYDLQHLGLSRQRFVLQEVQKALQQTELDAASGGLIAVTGESADQQLCDALRSALAVTALLLSPLTSMLGITKESRLDAADIEPCLGVALGCGLWGFND